MCSSCRCLSRREALSVWSPVTTGWGISGKYKTSVKEIEGEECVQQECLGGTHRHGGISCPGSVTETALALSGAGGTELAAGTVCDRRWWELCCQCQPTRTGLTASASESLLTHSHHHGPSACAGLWLLLRAQGGFHTHPGLPSISGSLCGEPWIHGSSGVCHVMKLCVQFPPWPGLEYFFPPVQWRNLFRPSSPCRGNPVLF